MERTRIEPLSQLVMSVQKARAMKPYQHSSKVGEDLRSSRNASGDLSRPRENLRIEKTRDVQ